MWKNPELLYQAGLKNPEVFLASISRADSLQIETSGMEIDTPIGRRILERVFKRTKEVYNDCGFTLPIEISDPFVSMQIERVYGFFFEQCLERAKLIEQQKSWSTVTELHMCSNVMKFEVNDSKIDTNNSRYWEARFTIEVAQTIHKLVGREDLFLAGSKGKTPFFKQMSLIKTVEEAANLVLPVNADMFLLNEDDLYFVPTPSELSPSFESRNGFPPVKSYRLALELLEDAYINFRYAPSPRGCRVVINGYPIVQEVWLKILPMRGGKSFGFIARFELDSGSYFMAEIDLMDIIRHHERFFERLAYYGEGHDTPFFFTLVCQIYHDLVTAKSIKTAPSNYVSKDRDLEMSSDQAGNIEECKPKFLYIPRVTRSRDDVVRTKSEINRVFTPRGVVGYIRKGNMTEFQRNNILEFQRLTGLRILEYIKEGYTFTRPHVSPKGAEINWDEIPTYIKARIQDDLKNFLSTEQAAIE